MGYWILLPDPGDPLLGMLDGVGVGKSILQIPGDVWVVGMGNDRGDIGVTKTTDDIAVRELDSHGHEPFSL